MTSTQSRAYHATFLAAILWGTSFPMIKLTLTQEVSPYLLSFLRLLIAGSTGLIALTFSRKLSAVPFACREIWALAFLNALAFTLQHVGLQFTTPSNTALLVNANVVFIAMFSALFLSEKMTWSKVAGILLGLAGVAVLTTGGDLNFFLLTEFAGNVLVFAAGIVWSAYVILLKRTIDSGADPSALSIGLLALTTPLLLVPLIFAGPIVVPNNIGLMGIVYLGLFCTLSAQVLWSLALRHLTATVASVLVLLEVLVSAIISITLAFDAFGPLLLLGGALILTSVYFVSNPNITTKRTRKRRST